MTWLVSFVKKSLKGLAPFVNGLLVALLVFWTAKIQEKADDAQDAADKGERVAKVAKKEVAAGYEEARDKGEGLGDAVKALAARVDYLTAEVEKLRAARARRAPRKIPPVKIPPKATEPMQPTPAAAAAAQE